MKESPISLDEILKDMSTSVKIQPHKFSDDEIKIIVYGRCRTDGKLNSYISIAEKINLLNANRDMKYQQLITWWSKNKAQYKHLIEEIEK